MLDRDLFGEPVRQSHTARLAASFEYPPFSVLNAREGWWQERKRQWLALGIKSEEGRSAELIANGGGNGSKERYGVTFAIGDKAKWDAEKAAGASKVQLAPGGYSGSPKSAWRTERKQDSGGVLLTSMTTADPGFYRKKFQAEKALGRELSLEEFFEEFYEKPDAQPAATGTSIFDPVLTELAYRWFAPPGGMIADPFAGGSVRGIVASVLGYQYTGFELRPEQVRANREQAADICPAAPPAWICGDSAQTLPAWEGEADLLFSCPPYGDLEVYSDLPEDISGMGPEAFLEAYARIIAAAAAKLKPNRFACFVVGDYRCKKGFYRNFPGETVAAFEAAGLRYYNEAILVTSVGSLPIRTGRQFKAGRKLGKTHQNVLVFVKGDPFLATDACNGQLELFGE